MSARQKLGSVLATLLLFLQSALIVTGGAVRLTGSGLGCPTWPECTPGSYTPVPHQAEGALHSWIEFGNRLLTFALLAAAIAMVIFVLRNKQRNLYRLASVQVLGIVGQGVLGGITVLTKLNPIPVAGHFLLSIALMAGAQSLRANIVRKIRYELSPTTRLVARAVVILTLGVITMGTVVTGSGPHAGDAQAPRTGFDTRIVALIHADMVIALLALTLGLLISIHLAESGEKQRAIRHAVFIFLGVALWQGVIGYVQYFTGLPEIIVAAHLFGATMVWLSTWNIVLLGNLLWREKSPPNNLYGTEQKELNN